MGAFQEERQVLAATPLCKWAHGIEHVHRIPFYVEMAVRQSIYGRPGATYLDIADDIITAGNTSSASIPLALSRMIERGEIPSGAPALLIGFGAGICYAAQVITVP